MNTEILGRIRVQHASETARPSKPRTLDAVKQNVRRLDEEYANADRDFLDAVVSILRIRHTQRPRRESYGAGVPDQRLSREQRCR